MTDKKPIVAEECPNQVMREALRKELAKCFAYRDAGSTSARTIRAVGGDHLHVVNATGASVTSLPLSSINTKEDKFYVLQEYDVYAALTAPIPITEAEPVETFNPIGPQLAAMSIGSRPDILVSTQPGTEKKVERSYIISFEYGGFNHSTIVKSRSTFTWIVREAAQELMVLYPGNKNEPAALLTGAILTK